MVVFLGLTPQANHLSPLRGSDRASGEFSTSLGLFVAKRRRRDRCIAWGVSPRYQKNN